MTKVKHHGIKRYRFNDNPPEKRFADAWEGQHESCPDHLAWLLDPTGEGPYPKAESERDRIVAATVIQWLGSPVGLQFVRDTLGYSELRKMLDEAKRDQEAALLRVRSGR